MAQVGALIWLRFRLLVARSGANVATAIFRAAFFFLLTAGALAMYFVVVMLFRALPPAAAGELLYLALGVTWVAWIVAPLLGMSFDDSTDLSKLLLYPMTPGRMTAGVLLSDLASSVMGFTVLLAVPVGWTRHVADGAIIAAAMGLLAVHMAALVESLRILLWDLLRSRRTRDLIILLSPLAVILFYAVYGALFSGSVLRTWAAWLSLRPSRYAQFLPSGLAAGATANAAGGRYGLCAAYLLGLVFLAAATVSVMAVLVRRVQAGEAETGTSRVARAGARQRHELRRHAWLPISEEVATVARKELLLFWRNPHFKIQIIQAVVFPIAWLVFIGLRSFGHVGGQPLTPGMFLAVIGLMLFSSFMLSANVFSFDGDAISALFLFPAPRRAFLAGKNLALWAALMALYVPAMVVLAALGGHWAVLGPALVGIGGTLLLALGIGNFLSIYAPYRVTRGKRRNPLSAGAGGPGCMGLVLSLAGDAATMVLAIPLGAALVLPTAFHAAVWYWLTAPAAAAYAWWVYRGLLGAAAARLPKREPEIIQAVGPAAGD